jgi:hypothetical protein
MAMIKVEWDKNGPLDNGLLPLKKISEAKVNKEDVVLGEEEPDKEWVTYQYFRSQDNSMLQPGFKLLETETDNVEVYLCSQTFEKKLIYDVESGFWFEASYFVYKNGNFTHDTEKYGKLNGISYAGKFHIKVREKNSNTLVHQTKEFTILPSVISYKQYQRMVNDLTYICDELAREEQSAASTYTDDHMDRILGEITSIIDKLEPVLFMISNNPASEIIQEWEMKYYQNIKKFDEKLMLERALFPYKEKYKVQTKTLTDDIYEHRFIKMSLSQLQFKLKKQKEHDEMEATRIQQELTNVEANLEQLRKEYLTKKFRNENTDLIVARGNSISKSLNKLKCQQNKINSRIKEWSNCIEKIDILLNLPYIQHASIHQGSIEASPLFIYDPYYSIVWKILMELKDDFQIFNDHGKNQLTLADTPFIFEIWAYFKMIHLLIKEMGWKSVHSDTITKRVHDYLKRKGNLEGFHVHLTHALHVDQFNSKPNLNLKLFFNRTINIEEEKDNDILKRPDFTFAFYHDEETPTPICTIYMDAKYHHYDEQGYNQWIQDLSDVAIDKYLNSFQGTKYAAKASFIIHCNNDEKWNHYGESRIYGIDKNPKHQFGSIILTPENTSCFLNLMRMIVEYHLPYYSTCWHCKTYGEQTVSIEERLTSGNNKKYYFKCRNTDCETFWVKSFCHNNINHRLIKHSYEKDNYHASLGNWYFKCPICNV